MVRDQEVGGFSCVALTYQLIRDFDDLNDNLQDSRAAASACARYYDAAVGRFLREDPLQFFAGSPDFYPYVRNKPNTATDPLGLSTLNLGGNVNVQVGPIHWQGGGGIVLGSDGSLGTYTVRTKGVGLGVGTGGSVALTGGISTAHSICGFGGPFVEVGENAGLGPGEGVSLFSGFDVDGVTPVGGGSISAGLVGGADAYTDITITTVTPIIKSKQTCGCSQ